MIDDVDVDLIIAVHSEARPIERAVASVLNHTHCNVRVTVVCHNLDPKRIEAKLLNFAHDPRLRVEAHSDNFRSPAGPFNKGLELATGTFTAVMGSDDTLQPGAIDSWLRKAQKYRANVVIGRLGHAHGRPVPTPPVRPFRTSNLSLVADRLSYRTAPLGLVKRDTFGHLRFTEQVRTGEDIEYGLALWSSGERIVFDRQGPKYLIHSDGDARVTTLFGEIEGDLEFLTHLLQSKVLAKLRSDEAAAFTIKLLRGSLFSLVTNRLSPEQWSQRQREVLRQATRRLVKYSEQEHRSPLNSLSRAENNLLGVILDRESTAEQLVHAALATRKRLSPDMFLTVKWRDLLRPDAPVRFSFSSALLMM